jgi:hypothetical protein
MDKRYQVFLSSTYEDLKEERLEVMKAILELDCIPCGMEYFPAASEDQWTYIKELINQCDYYVVIVAARYGSTDPNGIGYTEKEYEYAVLQGVPAIAFLHSDPGSIASKFSEETPEGKNKLKAFRKLLESRLCKNWSNVYELGAVVSRSLTQLIKRNPRPGWVRAEGIASAEASEEILRLKRKLEEQEKELERLRLTAPAGSEFLAQGSDQFELQCRITLYDTEKQIKQPNRYRKFTQPLVSTWDEIYSSFGTHLLSERRENEIPVIINGVLSKKYEPFFQSKYPHHKLSNIRITEECFQAIKLQFNALGLVDFYLRKNTQFGIGDTMAQLTPLGKQYLVKLSAIHKSRKKNKSKK